MKTIELNDGYSLNVNQSETWIEIEVYNELNYLVDCLSINKEEHAYYGFDYSDPFNNEIASINLQADYDRCKNVFVYGTLRSGFNNNVLIKELDYKTAKTKEKYEMTANGIPFVNKDKPTSIIKGEVFEMDTIFRLADLDRLESHPTWYVREIVEVELDSGEVVEAWIYFNKDKADTVIKSGDYKDYKPSYIK
jgi:gamma-glutamylcyclotransferase (GGCT)/AIG2-like uncharacterized protein YtfP